MENGNEVPLNNISLLISPSSFTAATAARNSEMPHSKKLMWMCFNTHTKLLSRL